MNDDRVRRRRVPALNGPDARTPATPTGTYVGERLFSHRAFRGGVGFCNDCGVLHWRVFEGVITTKDRGEK